MGNSESSPSSNTRNRQRTFQQTNSVYSTTPRPPQVSQQTSSVHSTTPRPPQVPQQTNSVHSITSQSPQVRLSNLNLQTGDLIDLTDPGKYPKNKIVDKHTHSYAL